MDQQKFQELVKKIEVMKKSGQIDLSMEEDLSIAVMNLVSLEEHFFFTAEKTKKEEYFDLLREVREMRKDLLGRLVSKHEGETWCISKHLLATTMRLMEVGTKFNGEGKKDEAKKFFDYAYKIYSIFWGLRLKLLTLPEVKKAAAGDKPWTLEEIVEKMVDCCDE
ncbi:MAG: hypothetical protein AAB601_02315 [Patescibacteria group bacterium]